MCATVRPEKSNELLFVKIKFCISFHTMIYSIITFIIIITIITHPYMMQILCLNCHLQSSTMNYTVHSNDRCSVLTTPGIPLKYTDVALVASLSRSSLDREGRKTKA